MTSSSIKRRPNGRWRARYRDETGREHARHFTRKTDGEDWLEKELAAMVTGTWVDPKTAKLTVGQWCDLWIEGYEMRRPGSVRSARFHIKHIKAGLGDKPIRSIRPTAVRTWVAGLQKTLAVSTTYAVYRRFAQIMGDAAHDGVIVRSPCSRKTAPGQAKQRPYVATEAQLWKLYDVFPEHLRPAILLGAFVGLRVAEAAAAPIEDLDVAAAVFSPTIQYPSEPLKSECSRTPVPVASDAVQELVAAVEKWGGVTLVTDGRRGRTSPWAIERAMRAAREKVPGLPAEFRFHDLRHFLASALIEEGLSVKAVQAVMRHASAKTTLDTYGHLWPDTDEAVRSAMTKVFASRTASVG